MTSQGELSIALANDKKLSAQMAKEVEIIEKAEHELNLPEADKETKPASSGRLIVDEEVPVGHVTWAACKSIDIFGLVLS